jgi:hypothetical protein
MSEGLGSIDDNEAKLRMATDGLNDLSNGKSNAKVVHGWKEQTVAPAVHKRLREAFNQLPLVKLLSQYAFAQSDAVEAITCAIKFMAKDVLVGRPTEIGGQDLSACAGKEPGTKRHELCRPAGDENF